MDRAHNYLFKSPRGLEEACGIVIDECFLDKGIDMGEGIRLSDLLVDANAPTARERQMLVALLANQKQRGVGKRNTNGTHSEGGVFDLNGPVNYRTIVGRLPRKNNPDWFLDLSAESEPFLDHDRAVATCKAALDREREYVNSLTRLRPDAGEEELQRFASEGRGNIKAARAFIDIWAAVLEVLEKRDLSPRLFLATNKKRQRLVRINKVLRIDMEKWSGLPVLLLDATLPDESILKTWFPDIVTTRIDAEMPFTHVRQVIGAPVAAGKLASEDAPAARRQEVRRYILQRWIETGRGETLVVCQLGYEKWLDGGLPPNIKIAHFGAIEGLDEFKRVRLLISIGRAVPGPQDAEELAALLSGRWRDVTLTHYSVSGGAWFERQFGGVTMADGSCRGS